MGKPAALIRLLYRARANEGEAGAGGEAVASGGPADIFAAIRDGRPVEIGAAAENAEGETWALLSRLDELWQEPAPESAG